MSIVRRGRPSGSGARPQVADAAAPGRPGQWLECRDRPDQHLHQRGAVPDHTHEVEEVLLVTAGECTVIVDGRPEAARTADAVIIKPGTTHAISHDNGEACPGIARPAP